MRNTLISILYWVIALVHLYTVHHHGEYPDLEFYTKAALMPVLILHCFFSKEKTVSKIGIPLILALIFSWIGDVVLTREDLFLFGLGAFFIAHVFYIISFVKSNTVNYEVPLVKKAPIFMYLLVITGGLIFMYLKPHLEEMTLPVMLYIAIITGMSIAALNRYKKVNEKSFWLVMFGAILFMVSDTIIAIDKFVYYVDNARLYIMFTYILAQYLIVQGTLKRIDEE